MSGSRLVSSDKKPAEGFLLVDKPEGPTSFDVVAKLRRVTGEKRIGHAGTLDPLATGLLVVGIGRSATRLLAHFVGLPKTYEATIHLGETSLTDDREGPIQASSDQKPSREELQLVLNQFVGRQSQIPPQYSAIKLKGKKAYEIARRGQVSELKPRTIEILNLSLIDYAYPEVQITVDCSSGTYIRSLARDLGEALGTGAYLSALRRTRIGEYDVKNSLKLDSFDTARDWTQKLFNMDGEF